MTSLSLPPTVAPTPSRPQPEQSYKSPTSSGSQQTSSSQASSGSSPDTTPSFTSFSNTTTDAGATIFPSATATASFRVPVLVPNFKFETGNVSYFVPLCSDQPQTLWFTAGNEDQRELRNFTLTCHGIRCDTGDFHPFPTDIHSGDCQDTTICDVSFCFSKRFDWPIKPENTTITCGNVQQSRLRSKEPCSNGDICSNITEISDQLAGLSNPVDSAGSTSQQALSAVGCAAQQAFQQSTAYYFESKLSSFNNTQFRDLEHYN